MNTDKTYTLYARIYAVVKQIAPGRVASYGDVAAVVGGGCDARTVGYALGELRGRDVEVPWQRVVNREGGISTRGLEQRRLLEAEGVAFDAHDRAIMARFRWAGPDPGWAAAHGFQLLPPRRDDPEQLALL